MSTSFERKVSRFRKPSVKAAKGAERREIDRAKAKYRASESVTRAILKKQRREDALKERTANG